MEETELKKVSDAEWEVMRVVWTKDIVTSQEIVSILSDSQDWKPSTVKSLINRLLNKKIISATKDGQRYLYKAEVTEQETMRSATENLFSHICAKKIGKTIADLIEEADLTFEDAQLIRDTLAAKEPFLVESIQCNCIPGQCECHEHN